MRPFVLLLPGLLCDAWTWRAQADGLADDAGLAADSAIADFAAHDSLTAMADAALRLAPPRFALAGHSMGARVALEIVARAPERVERLALLDTGTHPRRPGEAEKRQALVDLAHARGMDALADQWLPPMVHPDRLNDAALMAELRAMVRRATPARFERQVRALLGRRDAAPLLPAIRCPTLIACGRQDAWSPVAQHQAMAAAIPGARLEIVEDSGHMTTVEQPAAVTALLRRWLSE